MDGSKITAAEKTELTAMFNAAMTELNGHYAKVPGTDIDYPVLDLCKLSPGKPFTSLRKTITDYENLFTRACRVTFRSIDPGVRSIATWVDLFTDEDVRKTKGQISAAWHAHAVRSKQQSKWTTAHARKVLGEARYDNLVSASKGRGESKIDHVEYSSLILEELPALKNFQFFFGQPCPHRKICTRQKHCIFIIHG